MEIKYVHTNIVAKDWKKLSEFYIKVFNCKPIYPERDLSGEWIENMTNINNARIKGIHLSLPGYENGQTLEIFQYEPVFARSNTAYINQQGFGHIAFHVDDTEAVLVKLIEYGGKKLRGVIKRHFETLGLLTAVYAEDPEGNFIEIQNWKK